MHGPAHKMVLRTKSHAREIIIYEGLIDGNSLNHSCVSLEQIQKILDIAKLAFFVYACV